MSILFSCIGRTDPVSNYRDGGVLHILRNYRDITKVYLYMSKEMWDNQQKHQIYSFALDDYSNRNSHLFSYEFIESDIVDADDYDKFYESFKDYILKIRKMTDETIYVNLSSGTPAMKMTLLVLATEFAHLNVKAIQVRDPSYQENKKKFEIDVEKVRDQIENNLDNIENVRRCGEPELLVAFKTKARNQIKGLIESYNYEGALKVFKELYQDENLNLLIKHLDKRQKLQQENEENIKKLEKHFNVKLYPIKDEKVSELVEYYYLLENLVEANKVSEFLLRLHPFIKELQLEYLARKCQLVLTDYINKYGHKEWLEDKRLIKDYPNVYNVLTNVFQNYDPKRGLSIKALNDVIMSYYDQGQVSLEDQQLLEKLCNINTKYRNKTAHELYSITADNLRNDPDVSLTPKRLLKEIWDLMIRTFGSYLSEQPSMYKKLNEILLKNL